MRRYEAVHGVLLEDPLCGRREGHRGQCRSALAMERQRPKDNARHARLKRSRRLHARLAAVIEAAAQAGERSRAA